MAAEIVPLPLPDPELLKRALACAEASRLESDPEARKLLEQEAMRLWGGHRARREAMYVRGRRRAHSAFPGRSRKTARPGWGLTDRAGPHPSHGKERTTHGPGQSNLRPAPNRRT